MLAVASDDISESISAERISEVTDGLGPMQRWERDRADPGTVTVIVQRVAEGERLKQVCRSRGWPYALVAAWVAGTPEVGAAYEQALRLAADEMAQETVAIADAAMDKDDVPAAKHQTDVRLKVAGKLYRERYGEQVTVQHSVDDFGEMLRRVSERKLQSLKASQLGQLAAIKQAQAPNGDSARIIEGAVLDVDVATVATEEEV